MKPDRLKVSDMIAEANRHVQVLSAAEAKALHGRDDVAFIDVRDIREVAETGRVAGARHVPRGMLEFWIDPDSPYHKPFLGEDRTFVFYCAGGWRSALAARTAQRMGIEKVAHIDGGFRAWVSAEGPVEPPKAKG